MLDLSLFRTPNEFSIYIENHATENHLTYVEAILTYCQEHHIEPDDVASKINKSLREKIANDFRDLNLLPPQAQLDV
jgi:hypothetical protein